MKSFLLTLLLLPVFVSAHPLDCFQAAAKDPILGQDSYYRARLCRQAPSAAPYECFDKTYRRDFNIGFNMAIDMCQGATLAAEPLACFDEMLKKYQGIRHIIATTLCSATTSYKSVIDCYVKAKDDLGLDDETAATLCAH